MSALTQILQEFRDNAVSERDKGTDFERLCVVYLRHEPFYRDEYLEVLTYGQWAQSQGLAQKDTGIDLIAITHQNEVHAIQCKNYAPDYKIAKSDIDSFFTASGKAVFSHRVIITTTNNWTQNATDALENQNPPVSTINLGGGFPANYLTKTNPLTAYAEEITRFLKEDFGDELPEIILEPGRSLVANAGILVSEVILVSRKSRMAIERWVFTDAGKFSGLIETMDESIKFPIWTEKQGELEDVVIAGPTCDSADIMYEDYKYGLPLNLASGDRLYWLSTGAYTTSYSSVEFNGFPPLKQFCI